MNTNLHLVIMAGGSGTRFWPKSTSRKPKQLLAFGKSSGGASQTLLQQTSSRFDGLVASGNRWIVTTELLEKAVQEDSPTARVLAEPQARNTAPCVYWAARAVAAVNPKAVMLVMPADHYIPYIEKFQAIISAAVAWAIEYDDLVTLGVKPSRPETGYGYLKGGADLGKGAKKVDAFVEKPNLARAEEFLRAGNYLWNGGMFVWRAEVILAAFDRLMPEMKRAWEDSGGDIAVAYPMMTATSIDYGIMEKAAAGASGLGSVVTFPLDCGWDDLGSWTSLENLADELNARLEGSVVSAGDLVAIESVGNIVDAPGRTVALLGVNDLIIVESGNAILVAQKNRAQDIKLVVEAVKKKKPELI